MRQSSESLAGRVEYLELPPLNLQETGPTQPNMDMLWLRGGYPRSYLAPGEEESFRWRRAFAQTFLERDLPQSLDIMGQDALLGSALSAEAPDWAMGRCPIGFR